MESASCRLIIRHQVRSRLLPGVAMVLWLALMSGGMTVRAAQLTASLDRDTITLGESASLSLTFEGSQSEGAPNLPQIPHLQITYNGQSSQVSFVNGQVSSTVTHNFQVTAKQPGD